MAEQGRAGRIGAALTGKPGLNLAQQLVEQLMDDIRSGKLLPGMKMPSETELRARFGVSRTVVREAVSRLQAAGLVESHQGKGSFVLMAPVEPGRGMHLSTINSAEDVLELMGFRLGIEVEAAGLAAASRSKSEADAITRTALVMRTIPSYSSQLLEADFAFHVGIARAAHNRFYHEVLTSLGPAMIAYPGYRLPRSGQPGPPATDEVLCREHEAIAQAIAEGDVDSARAAMRLHLVNTRNRLTRKNRHTATPHPLA